MTFSDIMLLVGYAFVLFAGLLVLITPTLRLGKYTGRLALLLASSFGYFGIPRDILAPPENAFVRWSVPALIVLLGLLLGIGAYRNRKEEFSSTSSGAARLLVAALSLLLARVCFSL